jgi:DHA1 family bicyclomycin/chloramphenicol resistance-like MFS transporter
VDSVSCGTALAICSPTAGSRPLVIQCPTVTGFFVYIGGSSFVLQDGLAMSRREYTVVFMTNAVAMVVSSVLFRALAMRTGPVLLRR